MLLAGAAILLWSSLAALVVRLRHLPPFLLVGSCLLIGALCGIHRMHEWGAMLRGGKRWLLLGVYGLFGYHFALFMALRLAPPVEANLINYLWPLLIVVLAPAFVRGVRLTARHIAAALCGFAGAALLVTGGHFAFSGEYAAGYALAATAAFIWSTFSLALNRLGNLPTAVTGLFCAVSGALALACHFLFEPAAALAAADIPWLIVLGVGPMGLAFFAWDAALKRGDPRAIGALSYVTPLLSTLILAAFGGAALTPVALAAMALIVGGAVLGTWRTAPRPRN